MARRLRCSDAGYVYHVLNRAVRRAALFDKAPDYAAFEKVLRQTWERSGMRLLSYVVLRNHWRLVVWPHHHGELSTYAQWLKVTHVWLSPKARLQCVNKAETESELAALRGGPRGALWRRVHDTVCSRSRLPSGTFRLIRLPIIAYSSAALVPLGKRDLPKSRPGHEL